MFGSLEIGPIHAWEPCLGTNWHLAVNLHRVYWLVKYGFVLYTIVNPQPLSQHTFIPQYCPSVLSKAPYCRTITLSFSPLNLVYYSPSRSLLSTLFSRAVSFSCKTIHHNLARNHYYRVR